MNATTLGNNLVPDYITHGGRRAAFMAGRGSILAVTRIRGRQASILS